VTIEAEEKTVLTDIADIANDAFDSAGVTDDTELEFSHEATTTDKDNSDVTPAIEDAEPVDQPEKKSTIADSDKKLYAGKYKTVEELEKAYTEKTQVIQTPPVAVEQKPKAEAIPDLDERAITLLMEQDEQDGDNYASEYFQDKIKSRDLDDFEVTAIKALDLENGTNLFQEYIATSTERSVMAKLQPVLQPLSEAQNRERYNNYIANEKAINDTCEAEFGKDTLDKLEAKLKDPNYINEVLSSSATAPVINGLWKQGQKALSHKMLLREAQVYESSKAQKVVSSKRNASVQPDAGSSTPSQKPSVDKADTIEEAWEAALAEN